MILLPHGFHDMEMQWFPKERIESERGHVSETGFKYFNELWYLTGRTIVAIGNYNSDFSTKRYFAICWFIARIMKKLIDTFLLIEGNQIETNWRN